MAGLLLPGSQPPLSHFGVTLLRHVLVTGLRYVCYHLGLPLPVKPPLRIEQLRLTFDPTALERLLEDATGGRAVAGAVLEPGGVAGASPIPVGAVFFHRLRLRWTRRRRLPAVPAPLPESRVDLEAAFREQLTAVLPLLNDALLAEILGSLARRRRRAGGRSQPPVYSHEAAAFLAGRRYRGERLGRLDPRVESWRSAAPEIEPDRVPTAAAPADRRGVFRETYREALDCLRPTLIALGDSAAADGLVEHREDLFFLPMELLGDLTLDARPTWLDGAILRNRGEYFAHEREASSGQQAEWRVAPLHPLP